MVICPWFFVNVYQGVGKIVWPGEAVCNYLPQSHESGAADCGTYGTHTHFSCFCLDYYILLYIYISYDVLYYIILYYIILYYTIYVCRRCVYCILELYLIVVFVYISTYLQSLYWFTFLRYVHSLHESWYSEVQHAKRSALDCRAGGNHEGRQKIRETAASAARSKYGDEVEPSDTLW